MGNTQAVPGKTKAFVAVVVVAGSFALLSSLYQIYRLPPPSGWLLLAALTLLSGSFTIKVPAVPATISVSETFVFASVLLFGTEAATITVALDAVIMTSWRHRREFHKVLFNATEPTFSIWVASTIFFLFIDKPIGLSPRDISELLGPVFILCLTYFLLNSWLTAIAIGLATHTSIARVWHTHFIWLSLNYFVGASVAVLIVQNSAQVGVATLSIILPLLIISYLTMKSSMGRLEDANKHVDQVNRLHTSTIETLAMAIDAKDQITHGHIRRVQNYAKTLSKALGMNAPLLVNAIDAAALLHDIGKLGIPEYILNKPGKLSRSEFETMKLHTALGADIVSGIDFPYPVVPIVRHHHENWDGSGYPDGLSGADIPIGARILSVVDCFDALTSDRPYRVKLSDETALEILSQRRGSMYDPLVVDTFIQLYRTSPPADFRIQSPTEQRMDQTRLIYSENRKATGMTRDATPNADEFERLIASDTDYRLIARKAASYLRDRIPTSVAVIYVLDEVQNELVAVFVSAETELIEGLRIPLAHRLSGWVGANRETIINSNAALDLGGAAAKLSLRNAVSTPIASGNMLFGVLALYRASENTFNRQDRNLVEAVSQVIAARLSFVPRGSAWGHSFGRESSVVGIL